MERKTRNTRTGSSQSGSVKSQIEGATKQRSSTQRTRSGNTRQDPTSNRNYSPTDQQGLEEKIRARAHQIYLESGDESASEMENWLRAEREIKEENS
jgi:hypothetical protein